MAEIRLLDGKETYILSVEEMRRSDAYTIGQGVPGPVLMGRAAQGLFNAVNWQEPVAILAGGGNNGGDGYALACIMAKKGMAPIVYQVSDKLSSDSRYYYQQALSLGVDIRPWVPGGSLQDYAMVVDAILGTGFTGNVKGAAQDAICSINASGAYIISADISSGLNGDTGEAALCVQADLTVSIGYYKQGLFRHAGPKNSGKLVNVDIGINLASGIL